MSESGSLGYGGESDAKRLARNRIWSMVGTWSAPRDLCDPRTRVLVLTGPDAADVRWLRGRGRNDLSRVVAIDTNPHCSAAGATSVPGAQYVTGDVFSLARTWRRSFDVMLLDFCSQMHERSVDYFARCAAFGARDGAVVCGAFSYGRESAHRLSFIQDQATETLGLVNDGIRRVTKGEIVDDDAAGRRAGAMLAYAQTAFRSVGCWFFANVFSVYRSSTERKVGTPMFYVLGTVHRSPPDGPAVPILERVESRPAEAAGLVRQVALNLSAMNGLDTSAIADRLNVSESRVRAWKAVATRTGNEPTVPQVITDVGVVDTLGFCKRIRATLQGVSERAAAKIERREADFRRAEQRLQQEVTLAARAGWQAQNDALARFAAATDPLGDVSPDDHEARATLRRAAEIWEREDGAATVACKRQIDAAYHRFHCETERLGLGTERT